MQLCTNQRVNKNCTELNHKVYQIHLDWVLFEPQISAVDSIYYCNLMSVVFCIFANQRITSLILWVTLFWGAGIPYCWYCTCTVTGMWSIRNFWNFFSDTSDTVRLTELGKIYLELGYLTKGLQVHSRALEIAKELDSDKAKHQVNLGESPVCTIFLAFQRITL